MALPHTQVLPFFPTYDPAKPAPDAILDYRDARNSVGHAQRTFLVYWGLRAFVESGGYPGIDIGGAGVLTPGCISVDWIGAGETPAYGGSYEGVNIKANAADLSAFGSDSFSCLLSSHLIEHLGCYKLRGNETQEEKLRLACNGQEIVDIFERHWIRVVKKNGYICGILPDEKAAQTASSSSLFHDATHNHAFDSRTFYKIILNPLRHLVEIVQYATWENFFSFEFVLRKK